MTERKTDVSNTDEAEWFGTWSLISGKNKDITDEFPLLKGTEEVGLWGKIMN